MADGGAVTVKRKRVIAFDEWEWMIAILCGLRPFAPCDWQTQHQASSFPCNDFEGRHLQNFGGFHVAGIAQKFGQSPFQSQIIVFLLHKTQFL